MHTQCPECDLIFTPEKHGDEIIRLRAENARYREALEFLKREYNGLVWRVAEKALKGE